MTELSTALDTAKKSFLLSAEEGHMTLTVTQIN